MTKVMIENYLTVEELNDKSMTDSMKKSLATYRANQKALKNKHLEKAVLSIPKLSKEEIERLRAEEEKKKKEEQYQKKVRAWELFREHIPEKFHQAKLKPFELNGRQSPNQSRVINEICSKQLHEKPSNLLFTGSSGLGKTHLSVALGIRYIHLGITPRFLQDKHFVALENWMKRQYYECDVLVLDDIAGDGDYGRIAPWESKMIRDLIYERADKGLPTIISTNFSKEVLEKYLGARVWSRWTCDFTFGNGFEWIDFGTKSGLRGLR